jgi:hypothetical protein
MTGESANSQNMLLAAAIAEGTAVAKWASSSEVPERIAYRWAAEPEVRSEIESIRRRATAFVNRSDGRTTMVLLTCRVEYSSPLVQYVNHVTNGNARRLQLANGGRNLPIGQVVVRVVVKPDDQDPGMMACGGDDQVMEVFEVIGIVSQNRETFCDRVDHDLASKTDSSPTYPARTGSCP